MHGHKGTPDTSNDPAGYQPPLRIDALLLRYSKGERFFQRTDIAGSDDFLGFDRLHRVGRLDRCDLSECDLRYSSFVDCSFDEASLHRSNLSFCKFWIVTDEVGRFPISIKRGNLSNATLCFSELPEANLEGATLTSANCSSAYLVGANFTDARLEQVSLSKANCRSANFANASLYRANLDSIDAFGSTFTGSILYRANLMNSTLAYCDFRGACLDLADLRAADLQGANLTDASLKGAIYCQKTRWPDGFDPIRSGSLWIGPGANLEGAYLEDIDFGSVDLTGANLRGSRLSRARFFYSSLKRADLSNCHMHHATFNHVDFSGAVMAHARMNDARFYDTSLCETSLRAADLSASNHYMSNFGSADLRGAALVGASFHSTTFSKANLDHAYLKQTSFHDSNFTGAQLEGVCLRAVKFQDTDVSPFCSIDLEIIDPCDIDWASVVRSQRAPTLRAFLVEVGFPVLYANYLVDCARSLDPQGLWSIMKSAFISHGAADEPFAKKLRDALHRNGVRTWLFSEDAIPGEKLHRSMSVGVNSYDRIILVCSKDSLMRTGVLNEIEQALAREAREGGVSVLIPIRLDDYIFDAWTLDRSDIVTAVRDRVVADFRGTITDDARFQEAFARLLGSLGSIS
jgi:uncharacterized protein YjbI with pentapeptide repeats